MNHQPKIDAAGLLTAASRHRVMTVREKLRTLGDRMQARRRAGKVAFPVVSSTTGDPYLVTYPYGVKSSAYAAGRHTGEDHACPVGSLALATSHGEVIYAGDGSGMWGPAYGIQVVIRMATGDYDYAHNHLSSVDVQVGDRVAPGQIVGRTGQTGNVTGPHTHFEARTAGGRYGSDVHPIRVKQRREGVNK